jgi:hypothetical protein
MEIAALASFIVLIVSWMALPDSNGRDLVERAPALRTQPAGAEA